MLFLLAALAAGIAGYETYARGAESVAWPSVDAVVLSSRVVAKSSGSSSSGGGYAGRGATSTPRRTTWSVVVWLGYAVEGRRYEQMHEVMAGNAARAKTLSETTYLAGTPFGRVFYDPASPRRSVIGRGVRWAAVLGANAASIFALCTAVALAMLFSFKNDSGDLRARPILLAGVALAAVEACAVLVHGLLH